MRQVTRLLPDLFPRLRFLNPSMVPPAPARMARAATANGVPPNTREIAALAHQLWVERGRPEGSRETDWTRAERRASRQAIVIVALVFCGR